MIESMTGYGRGRAASANYEALAEIKAVNHRYTEFNFRLPAHYLREEIELKNRLQSILKRGKIHILLTVTHRTEQAAAGGILLDRGRLIQYYHELQAVARQLGSEQDPRLPELLNLPGVLAEGSQDVAEEEWAIALQAVDEAAARFQEHRREEGAQLLPQFQQAMSRLGELLEQIEPHEAARTEALKQRMEAGLKELGQHIHVDQERYQQELFFYLEKYDIAEEKARIRSHLQSMEATLAEPESNGRKLLFQVQELWREVNTLGNKGYHAEIQSISVQMKEELEKMKEQLMNIL